MKKVLFNVIIPVTLISVWMITCYPVCMKQEGFDLFLYWILVGFPFGIKHMYLVLIPKNYGIAGSVGVLALNGIIGGLIGGIVLLFNMVRLVVETVKIITGHFWTKCPKV